MRDGAYASGADSVVLEARSVLERHPCPVGVIDAAIGRIVWANAAMRSGLQCEEWPRLDLRGRYDHSESELAVVAFDEFVRSGVGFSMVRSFAGRERVRRMRCTYWALSERDGTVRFAGVLIEPFESPAGRTLTEWLDDWPQACALIHEHDGVVFFNKTLRQLLDFGDLSLTPEHLSRFHGVDESLHVLEALRDNPTSASVVEVSRRDGKVATLIVARSPMPPDADPALILVVANEISARSAGGVELPSAFSAREREVAELLLVGHRVSTIAATLFVSPHTVRNHLRSMFAKASVASQGELVAKLRGRATPNSG
jgi:DNA-binding CsgD family transcriptional regulator